MKVFSFVTLSLLLGFISGCVTVPETKVYNIRFSNDIIKKSSDPNLGPITLFPVQAEKYLKQPFMVYRKSPYQIVISKFNRWDSAPRDILTKKINEALYSCNLFSNVYISNFQEEGSLGLRVNLRKFERYDNPDGSTSAELEYDARLLDPAGKEIYQRIFSLKKAVSDSNPSHLAEAMSQLIEAGISGLISDLSSVSYRSIVN